MTTVVVAGAMANKPHNGGEAWVRLSWIRGLQQLGIDTWFVEELPPESCRDRDGEPADPQSSVEVAWFRDVMGRFGLADRATLLVDGEAVAGPGLDDLLALASDSALVNISGHLPDGALFRAFRTRAMIDIDPGFTQIWHAMSLAGARVEGHDLHFTIGENIGRPGCPIPTSGIHWRPIRQPVVLADWPVTPPPDGPFRFTTVSTWRTPFGAVEWDGQTYPLKHHMWRQYIDLPRRVPDAIFEIALDIHPGDHADREALLDHGWRLVDPKVVAGDPESFRTYVQGSHAEFSVAHGIYAETGSGWSSDRTVRYLTSGRPAVVLETGARAEVLNRGCFTTPDRAAERVRAAMARAADPAGIREQTATDFAAPRALAGLLDGLS